MLGEQDVGAFDVAVEDVHAVQGLQGVQQLDGQPPDLGLGHRLFALLIAFYQRAQVAALGEFRYQQQSAAAFVVGGVLVGENVGVSDGGENPDFIEGVGDFASAGVAQLDFLHGVDTAVLLSLDFVDAGEGTFPHLADHFEVLHFVN